MFLRHVWCSVVLAFATDAFACDCKSLPTGQRVRLSDAVFVGRVVAHEPLGTVRLAVVTAFKGRVRSDISVPTARSDCDFFVPPVEAREGEEFLVFLSVRGGDISANRCLGSAPVAQAAADLAFLRARRAPRTARAAV